MVRADNLFVGGEPSPLLVGEFPTIVFLVSVPLAHGGQHCLAQFFNRCQDSRSVRLTRDMTPAGVTGVDVNNVIPIGEHVEFVTVYDRFVADSTSVTDDSSVE